VGALRTKIRRHIQKCAVTLKNEAVAIYISGNVSRNRILIPVPYHKRSC
jgi:hypothetical protein